MKVLVFSDTHQNLYNAIDVLEVFQNDMDMVLHLGDHDLDAMELQKRFPDVPFHFVLGNNDYGGNTPMQKMIFACGKKLLLTHGHRQRVYWGYDTLAYWAEEQGADMVLFGHTHRPMYDDKGRVTLLNPGSISMPRDGNGIPTFATVEIQENGVMQVQIWEYHAKTDIRKR